ncbi:MAG: hypothetical protein IJJ85_04900 [Clostridia bacterium]|nr:hypothetical protein [Clostridia bacterium]
MKKYKILLSILTVVLLIVAVVVVTGVLDINSRIEKPTEAPLPGSEDVTVRDTGSYRDAFIVDNEITLPMLKTDIENVFYTMSKQGDVRFYLVQNGKISALEETGNYELEVECSSQKLPATIHYIERGGQTYGCGLFTNLMHTDVMLYDYAFFKVTNMFEGYSKKSDGDLLLLLDVDNRRFYSDEKIYSEIFYLHADHDTEYFLSEAQRTVGLDARMKTDYKMFTDAILKQEQSNVLFFSSRRYVSYAENGQVDIFTSGQGTGTENLDNVHYITDIASLNLWRSGSMTYYFANRADGTGFDLMVKDGSGDPMVIRSFDGSLKDDYVIDGDYIFSKSTGLVFNVIDHTEKQVNFAGFKANFKADGFAISPNGKYCVVHGSDDGSAAACGFMNFDKSTVTAYSDKVFGYVGNMTVLNDGSVLLSVAAGDNAANYTQLIASAK